MRNTFFHTLTLLFVLALGAVGLQGCDALDAGAAEVVMIDGFEHVAVAADSLAFDAEPSARAREECRTASTYRHGTKYFRQVGGDWYEISYDAYRVLCQNSPR